MVTYWQNAKIPMLGHYLTTILTILIKKDIVKVGQDLYNKSSIIQIMFGIGYV